MEIFGDLSGEFISVVLILLQDFFAVGVCAGFGISVCSTGFGVLIGCLAAEMLFESWLSGGSDAGVLALALFVVPSSARCSLFRSSKKVNEIFVFGDSTADIGNNNYRTSDYVEKANFKPYGIDYSKSQPTGRFSNGYNIIDYIAKYLGFEESPPASMAHGSKANYKKLWLSGANFASGGSGVLDSTGSGLSMATQIQSFKDHKANVEKNVVTKFVANWRLTKSLFVISTGSNDVFNFYLENEAIIDSSSEEKTGSFIKDLAEKYTKHVSELHKLGARKFLFFNVGMIGCCPFSRTASLEGECNDRLNQLAQSTNHAIAARIEELSYSLKSMKYSIGSTYDFMSDLIDSPPEDNSRFDVKSACCGNEENKCSRVASVCVERSEYLFWNMTHTTQKAAEMARDSFIKPKFIIPITIEELVKT